MLNINWEQRSTNQDHKELPFYAYLIDKNCYQLHKLEPTQMPINRTVDTELWHNTKGILYSTQK